MWNLLNGKSNGAVDDRQSQSSRRKDKDKDQRTTRRRSESAATSDLASKSSRKDDRDRASNSTSIIDSSTKQSAFPGTASASISSSYVTAKSRTGRDDNNGRERVSERRKKDRSPSPERRRDKKGRNDSRERKERKREKPDRRDRMDEDIAKDGGRSEYNYSNGRTQESTRGDFNAQIGSSGFVQFPGQYEGGFVGGPPTRPGDMSSHAPDQFPGQFPTVSARPYRPPLSVNEGGPGLAADYYGDVGQSVSEQPGVRPQQPSRIIGAEPHLQPASSTARPPPEPSAPGGVGAAASFFSDHSDVGATNVSHQASSSKPGSTYTESTVRPNTQSTSTSASGMPIMGAAAAGAAAGYFASTAINSHEHQSQHASWTAGSHSTMNQRRPSYSNGHHGANSQYMKPITPGKHSSQSSTIPLYGAGAAGLAAAAYHPHHQSSPYHSTSQPFPTGSMAQKHRHRGPLSTFVDFFKDPEGVAQFEEYTEYIGVCRDCFAPGSSPREAPRKHNYRRRRSNERYGSSMRVDKDSRYSSSDSEKRRKKNKSWLEAGITGYGLGKVGQTLFNQENSFDDAYSVKSGRVRKSHGALSPDRKSYTSRGTTRRSFEAPLRNRNRSREHVETGITSDGRIYKKDSQGGNFGTPSVTKYRVRRRSMSRSRSRSHSRDYKSRFAQAAVGAAIGATVLDSKSRRRDSSPERAVIRVKEENDKRSSSRSSGHGKRHSPRYESNSSVGSHVEGRRRTHRKKKKNGGFFSFGNSSSSSDIGSGIDGRYNKRREKRHRDNGRDDHRKAELAVAGLSAAAAALTLEQTRQNNKSKRRGDVVAVKEAKEKRRDEFERRRKSKVSANSDEDVWESASEGDPDSISSDLAYGSTVRRKGSRSSLSSDSSATNKWLWRWGSKKKRSDRDRKWSSPPYAGVATSAADESFDTRKLDDIDDRQPRITMHSNSSLPLQQVYPVPTSDQSRFDVATKPSALPPPQPFINNQPDPVQIQHPQPITPVSPAVYTTQSPYNHPYSVSAGGPSNYVDFAKRTVSEPISGAYHNESQWDVPGSFPEPLISTDNTNHGTPRESKPHRRDSSAGRHAAEVVQTFETPRRRTSLREGSAVVRFDLPEDKSERIDGAEPHHIERDYEERPLKERYEADPEQIEREAKAVRRSSREGYDLDKRRQENLSEVEDRQHSHEKNSTPGKSISWVVPAVIGAAALAEATTEKQATRSDDSEEERRERRRRKREARRATSEGVGHNAGASKSEDDFSERRRDQPVRQEAAETNRNPSYEDYAEFFAPTELLSKSPQYKEGAAEADADNAITAYEIPKVITIEPTGFRDSREAPAYKFGSDGEEIDPDPIPPPWVPKLKLVSPTPQSSSVNGSEAGDELPIDPHGVAKEVSEVLHEAHETTQDVPQDIQTPEYTIIEPKGDRQQKTGSPPRQETMRAVGSNAATTDMYQVEGPLNSSPRKSVGEFGDDLEFAGTLAAGLSEAGFDPSIVVDDPTFRRRESPPGSEKAGTYRSPIAEVLSIESNEMSKSQVVPHEQEYVDDEVTSHMPGAFDEDEQILEFAETESRLSKKERKKKDKQAKRQDTNGSHSNGLHDESLGQSCDIVTPPETQDQEPVVLVEDPEEYVSAGAQPTDVSSPFATEASKDRKVNENLRRKGSALDDDTSVATAPTIQAQADTYLSDEARSMSASVQAASGTTKDKKKKKKSRRTGSAVDDDIAAATPPLVQARDVEKDFSDDARSSAAVPKEKRRKKSKRGDSAYEEESSVVSSSTTRDEARSVESKPRSKKGGLFGLFGRSSVDVSEPSHPGTEAAFAESADVEEPKKRSKKRSKDRPSYRDLEEIGPIDADADDDPATISGRTTLPPEVSIPASTGHDPFLPSNDRLTNPEDEVSGRSLEINNNDLSSSDLTQNHDSHNHSQPISFLGMRQGLTLPPDIPNPADLVPEANRIEKSEPFFEAIAESTIASRRSSSPTGLHRVIEPDQGTDSLPSSPTGRPKVPSQRLSELQKAESPQHTPSPTAVPFHFRIPPSSPSASRASASQPHTPSAPEATSAPSRPKLRPRSTEFKSSNEFRPLWLVSKHASRREGPIDEVYPSLPSSHTTSRSSSVHDADEYRYGSAWDHFLALEDHERLEEGTDVQIGGMGTEVDLGLLDSQQPTPTAASFPAAIREDIQPSLGDDHKSLEQSNLTATKVQLDELRPLPVSGPSSPAMSVTQNALEASPDLKAFTLGAVLGASVLGAVGADHHQHATTASSDREGKELESEMVETAPPRVMVSAIAANEPATILENEGLTDEDRPAAERRTSNFYTNAVEKPSPFDQPPAMLSSTQRGDVARLSADEQRMIQEQDTQDAVELLFSPTSEKRSERELKRKGRKKGRAPLSTGLQNRDVGEPSASDISTMTSIDDTGKPSVEELAMQEAIDSVKKSDSTAEAKAQGGPALTEDMPVVEIVERMSNAAERSTGDWDTLPASSTTKRENSAEFQLQAAPTKSKKRPGKNKKRGSSATWQEYPVEESSMAIEKVRELEPSGQFEQSSVNEVENPSTNLEVSNVAREVPTTETPGASDSVLELPGPAVGYDKPISSSKRKAKKGAKIFKEPAQPEPELEHVSGPVSASQPRLDGNGASTTDPPISESTFPLGDTSEFLPHQIDPNFELASMRKSKKSSRKRKNIRDDENLEQETLAPESAALQQNSLGTERITENTINLEENPRFDSYQTSLHDPPETEILTYIPRSSTLSPEPHVQPEDVPLPESTDLDLFVTTPPSEALPAETEPSDPKLAIADSSATQVIPQYSATLEERSQSSPVATDQQDDPTNRAPTEVLKEKGKMEEEKPGQSTDGEAVFNAEHVDTVGLNKAMELGEDSITIACDPSSSLREADDSEPHDMLEHGPLQSDPDDSEVVGNVVVPDEIELPELKSSQTDTTIHDDLQHMETVANGADIIEEPFNEADIQGSTFAQTSAVDKEEGRQPMFTESAQTEMESRIPDIVSPEPVVGSGLSSALDMPFPQSESVVDPSPPTVSGPVEESSQLGSSLETSEPITADEVELPQSPVIANQPVSGTQVLEPREMRKDARYDAQILVPETVANLSQFELNSQTSRSARMDEAELPVARYSISGNQPISYQPDPESSGPINDSSTEILEPIVATVDRSNASPSGLSPIQQSYNQAERLPPIFDKEFHEMAPNIQSSSPPKPDVFAFLVETLREEKEPHNMPMDSPTVDQAELKEGWDAPGQPAKTDTSQSVKEILGMTGTTPTEVTMSPSLSTLTVDSEVLVPQIQDEGNDDNLSGLSKKQKKKGKKSRANHVPKPATDFAEPLPTAEPPVALTNTAEDVQTILDVGSAEQASALTGPRPESVVPETFLEIAKEGLDDDQMSLPHSAKSKKPGRGKYVERETPEDSLIVEAEALEAQEQPFVHIETLEDEPLPEHGDNTSHLEKSDNLEGLDAPSDHGMEPVGQNKEIFAQLNVGDVMEDSKHELLHEERVELVEPVGRNKETLHHPRSVDEVQDPEPGAFRADYMKPVKHSKETLDHVKYDDASKGSEPNVAEEEYMELMGPGKDVSNSRYSINKAEHLEPESASESLITTETRSEEGPARVKDIVQPDQSIPVEPFEISSAKANDLSPSAKEANEVPPENIINTQLDAESIGITSAVPFEEKSRNEALSASRQNFEEPSMSPAEIELQAPVASELSDSAKAVEEALESQDLVRTAPSLSKKDKKKATKKNKIAVREDEPHIPEVDSHEANDATRPASDPQVQASQSSKKDKKRGKKIKQAFAWEESVASPADNNASTVQHGLVLDIAPEQSKEADEEVDSNDLNVSGEAVNERNEMARDEVDLDSAAISSKAETNSDLSMTKKDKKKKKKATTSPFESFNDDVPTPVPAIEAEILTTDTVRDSPAEPIDLTMDAPAEGLEDISNRKKKSKKDKKREKAQLSLWDEETAPQAEVVGPTEAVPELPAQESSETIADFANDIADSFNTSRKSKKGRKGKKPGLQSSFDDSESTRLENVTTPVVPISENPVQSVQGSLPTIDEVRVFEPAEKAVDESRDHISLEPADNPDEASIMEIQPSDGQALDFEEPESTHIVSGKKGKKNKFKKKNPITLPWDNNETPQVETTDAESSNPRTTPTPALKLQDQNVPLEAEYEHRAHGSDVQTPVTAFRDAPTEEAAYELKKPEYVEISPTTIEHSVFPTELESQPDPDPPINSGESKWERSEMQPRVLDLDEEIEKAAPQVVEESIPEGSSKASLDEPVDELIQPHLPESVEEPNQQQIENSVQQYTEGPVQPHVGESIKTQLEEPVQSHIEESFEVPLEKPSQPHLRESVRSQFEQRGEFQPTEPFLGPGSGYTDFTVGEHNSMQRTKESAVPDEEEEVAQATSQIGEEPLEGDFSKADIGPYLEKSDTEPPLDRYESTVHDRQAPDESEPETPNDVHRYSILSQALDQKQNLATPDAEANQTAEASLFNSNTLSDTLTAVTVSTSPEQAHKRSFFEDEGPEVTVEDEAAIEPPPKTTRTDADPPSQKIVDMEEELFAQPRKSKKKKSKKAGYEASTVDRPHQSTQFDNVPGAIPSGMDQADTLKPEYLSSSAEPSQPGAFPGLTEVQDEDVAREMGLGDQTIEPMNEVYQSADRWEPQVKKGKKGKKQKSTPNESRADLQVIETKFVDFNPSEYQSQGNLDVGQPFQSIPPALNAGTTDAYSEYVTHDDPSVPHQRKDTTQPTQPATTYDESAFLLATNPLSGSEALPQQEEESSPFVFLPKNKKGKKKKKAEPIIWEDDTATAPVVDQEDEDIVQKPTPIPGTQSATSEFDDLRYRSDEPPRPQSSYPEITVGALEPTAQRNDEHNDYFGAQAQEAGRGLDIDPQVPPFEPQEQVDDKASINSELPEQDVVGLVDKSGIATKTGFNHQAPQHIPDGKVIAVDEKSELVDEPYQRERIESQPMPERLRLDPEENFVGEGEDVPVLADNEALQVDDEAVEQAQNTPWSVANEDNGLQEQQITPGALEAAAVLGSDDTQLVDPSVEGEVFAIPVSKKSKKKSKRRAYATETIDPRDLEDSAYKEAIDQRVNSSMPRSRSTSPRQSSKITEDPTQDGCGAESQEGHATAARILGAGASVAENLARRDFKKSAKNKKKRKGKVWEGEELDIPETISSNTKEEAKETLPLSEPTQQVSLTPPRSPEPLSTQKMEDYATYDNRQVNRDSAVHVSDSPIVSDSLPAYHMVRDSGYQDTEASPIVGLRRSVSFDRMSTTEAPFVEQTAPDEEGQVHDTRETQVPEEYADNPYNIPVEADPAHARRALSPVLESRDASRSPNDYVDDAKEGLKVSNDRPSSRPDNGSPLEPMSLNPIFPNDQRSAAGRSPDALGILPSAQTQGDRRERSPVSPSSKDRSSVLFQSSPSTREELASVQQRSSSPLHEDEPSNERAISPIRGDKDAITDAPPHQSLFGGPLTADSERPSPATSPMGMEDSTRRPLDTIREYSAEQSPLQRKTRTRPHSPSPERGNRRRRTADRQEAQRGHVPDINTNDLISTDEIISGLSWPAVNEDEHVVDLEGSRSGTTDNRAPSRQSVISPSGEAPKPRSFSGASIRSTESINAIIRTPDQIRSASGLSYHSSGTPPLRRVDRSISGDLRAKGLAKQIEPAPKTIASSSIYDPTKDKGKDRMADVYVSPFLL